MVGDKNRRVTSLYLLQNCRMLIDDTLKLGVVLFCDSNTLCETQRDVEDVIFKPEEACIGYRGVFKQILMNVLRIDQPLEIYFEHYGHVPDKQMFHMIVRGTLMFLPNEIPDKPFYNKPVLAHLIQKVALAFYYFVFPTALIMLGLLIAHYTVNIFQLRVAQF